MIMLRLLAFQPIDTQSQQPVAVNTQPVQSNTTKASALRDILNKSKPLPSTAQINDTTQPQIIEPKPAEVAKLSEPQNVAPDPLNNNSSTTQQVSTAVPAVDQAVEPTIVSAVPNEAASEQLVTQQHQHTNDVTDEQAQRQSEDEAYLHKVI